MAVGLEQFVKSLEDSGIITPSKLRAVREKLPSEKQHDAQELARELVRLQKLTKFQAQEAYQGKAKSLVLGNYLILDKIGAGGMGQVYKAEHRRMKRIVAIKMLPRSMMKDAAAAARFQREVEAAARLQHPNIVAAHDADESHGIHFLVMEYVEGSDLSALVKKNGPFAPAKAVDYITQAARGLEAAHAEGIVHRDIKPANLLLDKRGVIKILDMGLARLDAGIGGAAATQAELTSSGQIMGTVDYMSPEQAFNTKLADARADIYSLGCTLYYLLTGKPLYGGESIMEKLLAHREKPIPPLSDSRDDVPEALEAVMQKMLAKSPTERYQSMTEVLADLAQCASESAGSQTRMMVTPESSGGLSFLNDVAGQATRTTARPAKSTTQKAKPTAATASGKSRRNLLVVGGVVVSVFLMGAIVFLLWGGRTPTAEPVSSVPDALQEEAAPANNFALDFNGETSHVNTPIKYDGSHPLTIEAWVKPRSVAKRTIASNESKGGFNLAAWTNWELKVGQGDVVNVLKSQAAATSDWQHVAGTFDGTTIALFVDGVLQGTQRCRGCKETDYTVHIGCNPAGRIGEVFDGAIDEVRISRSVRYTADFTPKPRFTRDAETLALYHFDENLGINAADDSGNGHDAKIVEASWVRGNDQRNPEAVAGGAVVDLFQYIDPEKGGLDNKKKRRWYWAIDRKVLASDTSNTDTLLPIDYSPPPAYVLEATVVTRKLNTERAHRMAFGLTSGKQRFSLLINMPNVKDPVPWSGLSRLDDKPAMGNETGLNVPRMVEAGEHPIRIEVRPDSVIAFVDGEKIVDYHGGNQRLTPQFDNRPEAECDLWVMIHDRLQFTKLTLTPLAERVSETLPTGKWALKFDGAKSYVEIETLSGASDRAKTIEAYVTPGRVAGDSDERSQTVINMSGPRPSHLLQTFDYWLASQGSNPNRMSHPSTSGSAIVDRRVHLASVWDGANLTLYVNGQPSQESRSDNKLNRGKSVSFLGVYGLELDGTLKSPFAGLIDAVRISHTARYTQAFQPEASLAADGDTTALYRFDEGQGEILKDSSGNEHHGKIHSATWFNADSLPK